MRVALVSTLVLPQLDKERLTATLRIEPQTTEMIMRRKLISNQPGVIDGLVSFGDWLLASDQLVTPHLTLLDTRSGTVLNKMGPDGIRPSELKAPACPSVVSRSSHTISIVDQVGPYFVTFVVGPPGEARVSSRSKVPLVVPECAFATDDDKLIVNAAFPDRVFYHFRNDGSVEDLKLAPPFPEEIPYNRKNSALEDSRKEIVVAYWWINRLEIFDLRGNRRKQFDGPINTEPRFEYAYRSVAVTPTHIFAGFCGCDGIKKRLRAYEIHVFNWDGTLVARLKPDHPIIAMTLNESGTSLYGSYYEDSGKETGVGEWILPKTLSK